MKKLILLILFSYCFGANAQVDKIWASYLGGLEIASGNVTLELATVLYDSAGYFYIAGQDSDTANNFATAGSFMSQPSGLLSSGFIAKFDTLGNRMWCTYIGNNYSGNPVTIAQDKQGNIVATASTRGLTDVFGTPGSYRPNYPNQGHHSYLAKFTPNGQLLWSTYLESSLYSPNYYVPVSITTDAQNNIVIAGMATVGINGEVFSGTYKTSVAANPFGEIPYCVLLKFSAAGNFLWGSYYGGTTESLSSVVCDAANNIYAVGYTWNDTNIASPGAAYSHLRADTLPESFLLKFSPQGQRIWATYTGGVGRVSGLLLDGKGGLYVLGLTRHSTGIATAGTHQQQFMGGVIDFCLTKWNTQNGTKLWGTYYGGTGREREGLNSTVNEATALNAPFNKRAMAIDAEGRIIIAGGTLSTDHIKHGCSHRENDTVNSGEGFIAKFYDDGHIFWGSYFNFGLSAVAAGKGNSFYVGGRTFLPGLATPSAFQTGLIGIASNYFSKMVDNYSCPNVTANLSHNGNILQVNNAYNRYQWYFNDEPIAGANIAQIPLTTDTGFYYVRFSDSCNCRYTSDTFYFPPASSAITAMENTSPFSLYPNPAGNSIVVRGPWPAKDNMLQLKIVSVAGRTIWQQKIPRSGNELNYAIHLSALPAGMYALLIPTENGMQLQKFVKE